jgi:hypothetical protein
MPVGAFVCHDGFIVQLKNASVRGKGLSRQQCPDKALIKELRAIL